MRLALVLAGTSLSSTALVTGATDAIAITPCGSYPYVPTCDFESLDWPQGDAVGYSTDCHISSDTHNRIVMAWQYILWVRGDLSSTSQIDGIFGSGTKAATKQWQLFHGLGQDGCVGYNTWYKARYGYDTKYQYGEYVRYYHMTDLGGSTSDKWKYAERKFTSRAGYFYWDGITLYADANIGCVNNTMYSVCIES